MIRWLVLPVFLLSVLLAGPASAQGFIAPYIGSTVQKSSVGVCDVAFCEDESTTYGFGVGAFGGFFGVEFDLGFTPGFFGEIEAEDQSSGMLTMMGNFLIGPKIGPVQPFGVIGLGVMKLNADFDPTAFFDNNENKLAWDIGGGVVVHFGSHWGIRGDFRHFRTVEAMDFIIEIEDEVGLHFTRGTVGVVFKF